MTQNSIESQVSRAVDAFMEEMESGQTPTIDEFAKGYPAISGILRQVLPAIAALQFSDGGVATDDELSPRPESVRQLGDFRIVREVGRGGMGIVYEAEQVSVGRRVALKVLPFVALMDPRQLQRFKNEVHAAGQLHHTNIVPIFCVGSERGVHYYAMQYIEGCTLAEMIRDLRRISGIADEGETPGQDASHSASRGIL